ncbi:hypothetical protein D9615_010004 [Tricholomella constricta]|uniref:NADP-dependent oxidoreductase domain-containing protein n=1 Tax=Tricholomella constricta TaxID=117010 RepID=A0A8H5GU87_9AGAR|nr:hypothetical protein D9615_010004 [Tricholomella constricta]
MGIRQPKWSANSMIAGAGGGLVASIATCPLDVVKTKLQAQRVIQGQRGYLGIIDTVKTILVDNGVRGLYRGLGPTILGYLPTWAIYFAVYDGIKGFFGEPPMAGMVNEHERLYPAAQVKGYQPTVREHPWSLHILSAMTAGAASTICTNPLWVIKTRFMTQTRDEVRYKHTLDAALTIYRTEGLRAFYRGLFPSLLGIAHVAVQFPLYEQLKLIARGDSDMPLSSQTILLCSAISKMTASIATYPHEVIRTRLQTQRRPLADDMSSDGMIKQHARRGVIYTTKNLIRKEGWTGLYRGLSINLLRTVPNSAVTMLTNPRHQCYRRPSSPMVLTISSAVKLSSGYDLPILGLSVYLNDDCATACEAALECGYRHTDTAQMYRNEEQVGAAVKASGIPRESIFITSKVVEGGSKTADSIQQSLKKLDLGRFLLLSNLWQCTLGNGSIGYIDLYLIHSAHGGKTVHLQTYKTLLEFSGPEKPLRSIGVSNYAVKHLEEIREAGLPTPAVNQIELHPFCQQKPIVEYCKAHGIAVEAYCPLIRGQFSNPVIREVSKEYGKSPAQILVRWSIQRGFVPLPKSSDPGRIKSNADIFNFELSDTAMAKLDALDRGTSGAISWNPVDVE